jgi:hypothetical protein
LLLQDWQKLVRKYRTSADRIARAEDAGNDLESPREAAARFDSGPGQRFAPDPRAVLRQKILRALAAANPAKRSRKQKGPKH